MTRANVLDELTPEERPSVDAAADAANLLKRTFATWVVIGRGLQTLKAKAERIGGRKTFQRLREQNNLRNEVVTDAQASNILRVLDVLPQVEAWRMNDLDDRRRYKFAAPNTVIKQCPVFAKTKKSSGKTKPKPTLLEEVAALKAAKESLEHRLKEVKEEFTVDQHFDALIELLKDEPQFAFQNTVNGFVLQMKRAWDARRKAKKPTREMTAEETAQEAGLKVMSETVGKALRSHGSKGAAKAKTKKAKADVKLVWKKHKTIVNAFVANDYEISRGFDAFSKKHSWTLLQGTDPDEGKRRCIAQGISSKEEVIHLAEADYKKRVGAEAAKADGKPALKWEQLKSGDSRLCTAPAGNGLEYLIEVGAFVGSTKNHFSVYHPAKPGTPPWERRHFADAWTEAEAKDLAERHWQSL